MPTSSSRHDQPAARCSQPGTCAASACRPGCAAAPPWLGRGAPAWSRPAASWPLAPAADPAPPPLSAARSGRPWRRGRPRLRPPRLARWPPSVTRRHGVAAGHPERGRATCVAQSCLHVTNYGGPMRVYHERLRVPVSWWVLGLMSAFMLGAGFLAGFDWEPALAVYAAITVPLAAFLIGWGWLRIEVSRRRAPGRQDGAAAGPGRPGDRAGHGPDQGAARAARRPGRVPDGPAVSAAGGVHRGRRPGRASPRTG